MPHSLWLQYPKELEATDPEILSWNTPSLPPVCSAQRGTMDFNVKKLASGAGVFFTRAVQVTRILSRRHRAPSSPGGLT
ncbi:hypothetical protein JOQ06_008251, partial [Pogonophryne albipinna]